MKHIFVRNAYPTELSTFVEWTLATKNNMADPEVGGYRSTFALAAYDKAGPVVFAPVQRPYMMEALAIKPGADPVDVAVALKELTQALVTRGHAEGIGEIYFLCRDASTIEYAKRQCFEEILRDEGRGISVLRIKLLDLEREKKCE